MFLSLKVSYKVIEALPLAGLQFAVAKHGVTINQLLLTLSGTGERSGNFEIKVAATKTLLFVPVSASVIVRGSLSIDDRFVLTPSQLSAEGAGFVGSLLNSLGLIQSKLRPWDGKQFSLEPLFPGRELGGIKVTWPSHELGLNIMFAD